MCDVLLRYQQGRRCGKHKCTIHLNHTTPSFLQLPNPIRISEFYCYYESLGRTHAKWILNELFTKKSLNVPKTMTKEAWIQQFLNLQERFLKTIRRSQQSFRRKKYKVMNQEDPFTFEKIIDISPMEVVQVINTNHELYQFRIHELVHHGETNGWINPFQRESFDLNLPTVLYQRLKELPSKSLRNPWETPTQAFLEVLYDYEKEGFYTSIEWFIQLDFSQIVNIFILFHGFVSVNDLDYFDIFRLDPVFLESSEKHQTLSQIILATEMKRLIQTTHSQKFTMLCTFFLVLATVQTSIGASLPHWIFLAGQIPTLPGFS